MSSFSSGPDQMSKANFFKRKKLWLHFKENRDDDFIGEDVKNWSYDDDPQHFYKSKRFGRLPPGSGAIVLCYVGVRGPVRQ